MNYIGSEKSELGFVEKAILQIASQFTTFANLFAGTAG